MRRSCGIWARIATDFNRLAPASTRAKPGARHGSATPKAPITPGSGFFARFFGGHRVRIVIARKFSPGRQPALRVIRQITRKSASVTVPVTPESGWSWTEWRPSRATIATTERYAHLYPEALARAVRKVPTAARRKKRA